MLNIPAGWKLVPERATKTMQDAWDSAPFNDDTDVEFHGAYAAMIAAAPASAHPERDWELTCDHCDGDGFVYVERRVGPCQTDIQTFKEECECCEGRGFTIAFVDIPGIAEYVRKTRPAPSAPGDAQDAVIAGALFDLMGFLTTLDEPVALGSTEEAAIAVELLQRWGAKRGLNLDDADVRGWNERRTAPAAGDALPTIKGAAITGGYVVVTPAGWGEHKAQKVRDAILRLFPVNPAYTPKPETALAAQQGKGGEA